MGGTDRGSFCLCLLPNSSLSVCYGLPSEVSYGAVTVFNARNRGASAQSPLGLLLAVKLLEVGFVCLFV